MRCAAAGDPGLFRRRACTATGGWARRWGARVALLTSAFLLLMLGFAGAASAHAVFVSAEPAPGASLPGPPRTLRIVFSEPLVAALSSVAVDTSAGAPVHERSAGVDPSNHSAYQVSLRALRPDRYTVVWHTTSEIDGHSRWGSYTFTVLEPGGARPKVSGAGAVHAGPPAPLPTAVQAATSWAGLAGLFAVTGAVLAMLLGGTARPDTGRAFRRLMWAAGAGTLIGVAGEFAATWAGDGWRAAAAASVFADGAARWWWLRLAGVAVAVLAWPRPGRPAGVVRRLAAACGVSAVIVGYAASGHPAASARPAAGLALLLAHVLAASVWLGGVLALALAWSLARRHGITGSEPRALLRRFSLVAGLAVPAVAATGAGSALLEFGSFDEFVTSGYGLALLVKLGVAAVVGAVAVATVRMHTRHPGGALPRRFRTSLWAEAGLGLLVLVPTATMSVLGPPGPADAARHAAQQLQAATDPAAAFAGSGRLGSRGLVFSLTPGTAGPNALQVEVDGRLASARLQVRLTGPGGSLASALQRTGYDHDPATHTLFQGTANLPGSGTWRAVVAGAGASSGAIVVPVRPAGHSVTTSGSSGSSHLDEWLVVIAVLGASGVVVAGTRALRHRRLRWTTIALGGTAGLAAIATAGTLLVPTGPGASAAVRTAWGTGRRAPPTVHAGATVWPVGGSGAGLMMPAVGPDGSVWVGAMDTNALIRLDPGSNVAQQITVPGGYKEIMGVAVDDDNHVWFAEEHAQTLGMFDPATGRFHQYRLPGADPAPLGVTVDSGGHVWFTAMNGDWIGRFDPATAHVTRYPVPTPHALPYWIAAGPDGTVWFAEFGAGKLGMLKPATGQITEYPLPKGSEPAGIAVGRSGTVWASTIQGRLIRLDRGGAAVRTYRAPAADDYGVAVGPDGTVWLGSASGGTVWSFDPATHTFGSRPLPAGSRPWWVTAGPHHVWVALGAESGGLAELDGAQ